MGGKFHEVSIAHLVIRKRDFRFSIDHGALPGENFICRIYRVTITESGNAEKKSLIFKVSETDQQIQAKFSSELRFEIESDMYQFILPALNSLLQKYGIAKLPQFPGTAA